MIARAGSHLDGALFGEMVVFETVAVRNSEKYSNAPVAIQPAFSSS
jgi:hypothetical protein